MTEKYRQLTELILEKDRIDISKYDSSFIINSIQFRMSETQCDSESSYFSFVKKNDVESSKFVDSLCVSYSEFFRNPLTFSVLEKIVIPSIVMNTINSNRKEIRIWSAACAAGQETYSLAILLKEISQAIGEKINFRIFSTDQSELQIAEAKKGIYYDSGLNNMTLKRLSRWFIKKDNTYHVIPELKESIDFSVFDLFAEDCYCPPTSIFGEFDIVVCANLLFYYQPKFRTKIIDKATKCLSTNGFLITSETEREILLHDNFQEIFPQSAIFNYKS
ncbi:MAG: CheR family methyltransferase [Paludibacter sp.]|nr:CheR family methyltransferase [Paludibacter sp.]